MEKLNVNGNLFEGEPETIDRIALLIAGQKTTTKDDVPTGRTFQQNVREENELIKKFCEENIDGDRLAVGAFRILGKMLGIPPAKAKNKVAELRRLGIVSSPRSMEATPAKTAKVETVKPEKPRKYRRSQSKKNWKKSELDYLKKNFLGRKDEQKNKKRSRHNKKVAKQLGRSLASCRLKIHSLGHGSNGKSPSQNSLKDQDFKKLVKKVESNKLERFSEAEQNLLKSLADGTINKIEEHRFKMLSDLDFKDFVQKVLIAEQKVQLANTLGFTGKFYYSDLYLKFKSKRN